MFKFFFVILLISLTSCKRNNKGGTDNIFQFPLKSAVSTLDPALSYDSVSAYVIYQAYEQLYQYHYLKRPYTITTQLAEELPLIEDYGKKYTIKIKKNVQYHPHACFAGKTRYLKAEDFITQLKRIAFKKTKSPGLWAFEGQIIGMKKFRNDVGNDLSKLMNLEIEGLKTINDHTLVISLTRPYPQLLNALAMSFVSPIPKECVLKYENRLDEQVIGTGPFKLDNWTRKTSLTVSRFKNYREAFYPGEGDRIANQRGLLKDAGKQIPFIDGIQFHISNEEQTRWLKFRKGDLDWILTPKDNFSTAIDSNGDIKPELEKDGIRLEIAPTMIYWWLGFNMNDPILGKNLNLRKAIAHAFNHDDYIRLFTNNTGLKANSIYPPGIPGYNPSKQLPYDFNLKKAKHFMKLAGYPNGKGLPRFKFDSRGVSTMHRQRSEFVKKQLKLIGINIDVNLNTFPAYLQKAREGNLQFWQDGWSMDYPDAENSLQLLVDTSHPPGPNTTYYNNSKFNNMFDKIKTLPDGPEKFKLMDQMENLVQKDLPWIMQYYTRDYLLFRKRIKNLRHSQLINNFFKYIRIDVR